MAEFRIAGGRRLSGRIKAQGSKNAVLPIFVASLLTDEPISLSNVPHLSDTETLSSILSALGKTVLRAGTNRYLITQPSGCLTGRAPHELVRKMRASFLVLGPLLARTGEAEVALPGGDAIGARPVDLHLSGLEAMGAQFQIREGIVFGSATKLQPAQIHLKFPSVGATEHLMMTAALIDGKTTIHNPAHEPEIGDLAKLLSQMGAEVITSNATIEVTGRKKLSGTEHSIIPDRLVAGTYAIAGAITDGDVEVICEPVHLRPLIDVLEHMGVTVREQANAVLITKKANQRLKAADIETAPYPGFPTDLQVMMMPLLALAHGTSRITERIYEDRFGAVGQLQKMGADVIVSGNTAIIQGVERMLGAAVEALDIRAGTALVLAGLAAKGETLVRDPSGHIARGYQNLGGDLRQLGAEITATSIA